jgi:hypothetical protein
MSTVAGNERNLRSRFEEQEGACELFYCLDASARLNDLNYAARSGHSTPIERYAAVLRI